MAGKELIKCKSLTIYLVLVKRNDRSVQETEHYDIYIYCTFIHLADAFIQTDVQLRK